MDFTLQSTLVPVDQLRPLLRDLGITSARLVAVGFDVRSGPQRRLGVIEVQYLLVRGGDAAPQRLSVLPVEHRPGFAYLGNLQSRHGRSVVEGDADLARVINEPEFARAHDVLLGLIRRGVADAHGDIFLVGSASRPWTWDASGRINKLLFGEGSRQAFLRLRSEDLLWAEDNRLVAAPLEALPELRSFTETRNIFAASRAITMLSRAHGRTGNRLVVTAGREYTELDLGENAAHSATPPTAIRQATGTGFFIGHVDPGRGGFKALVALETRATGGWQLAILPISYPQAPASSAEERA